MITYSTSHCTIEESEHDPFESDLSDTEQPDESEEIVEDEDTIENYSLMGYATMFILIVILGASAYVLYSDREYSFACITQNVFGTIGSFTFLKRLGLFILASMMFIHDINPISFLLYLGILYCLFGHDFLFRKDKCKKGELEKFKDSVMPTFEQAKKEGFGGFVVNRIVDAGGYVITTVGTKAKGVVSAAYDVITDPNGQVVKVLYAGKEVAFKAGTAVLKKGGEMIQSIAIATGDTIISTLDPTGKITDLVWDAGNKIYSSIENALENMTENAKILEQVNEQLIAQGAEPVQNLGSVDFAKIKENVRGAVAVNPLLDPEHVLEEEKKFAVDQVVKEVILQKEIATAHEQSENIKNNVALNAVEQANAVRIQNGEQPITEREILKNANLQQKLLMFVGFKKEEEVVKEILQDKFNLKELDGNQLTEADLAVVAERANLLAGADVPQFVSGVPGNVFDPNAPELLQQFPVAGAVDLPIQRYVPQLPAGFQRHSASAGRRKKTQQPQPQLSAPTGRNIGFQSYGLPGYVYSTDVRPSADRRASYEAKQGAIAREGNAKRLDAVPFVYEGPDAPDARLFPVLANKNVPDPLMYRRPIFDAIGGVGPKQVGDINFLPPQSDMYQQMQIRGGLYDPNAKVQGYDPNLELEVE